MEKNLSGRIAQRAKQKKLSHSAQNRVAFLAIREDIKRALDDGWPIKNIWEVLYEEKKITISYQSFARYVNKLILSVKTETTSALIHKQSHPTNQISSQTPGFVFNPIPNKKDLL